MVCCKEVKYVDINVVNKRPVKWWIITTIRLKFHKYCLPPFNAPHISLIRNESNENVCNTGVVIVKWKIDCLIKVVSF